jgi:hypothetical protein
MQVQTSEETLPKDCIEFTQSQAWKSDQKKKQSYYKIILCTQAASTPTIQNATTKYRKQLARHYN